MKHPADINRISKLGNSAQSIASSWMSDKDYAPDFSMYRRMFEDDDIAALAYQCLGLMIVSMVGEYHHDDESIMDEGRRSLAMLRGSWKSKLQEACAYTAYGYYLAEPVYEFDEILYLAELNPFQYEPRPHFYGTTQEIFQIQSSELKEPLPYLPGFVFHLVNEPAIAPKKAQRYGFPMAKRACKAWDAHRLISAQYIIASQKQVEKLLIGKTKTQAQIDTGLVDSNGDPIYKFAGEEMRDTLEQTQNGSVAVIDIEDDVMAVDQGSNGEFYLKALDYFGRVRSRSFYNPQTLFGGNNSGVGDAGLAESQQNIFLLVAAASAEYLGNECVEQLFRPMHEFNHGKMDDYGIFPTNQTDPKALEIAKVLVDVLKTESLSSQHEAAIRRISDLLGMD